MFMNSATGYFNYELILHEAAMGGQGGLFLKLLLLGLDSGGDLVQAVVTIR